MEQKNIDHSSAAYSTHWRKLYSCWSHVKQHCRWSSHLVRHLLVSLLWACLWVGLYNKVPSIQLYNIPILDVRQDFTQRFICVTLHAYNCTRNAHSANNAYQWIVSRLCYMNYIKFTTEEHDKVVLIVWEECVRMCRFLTELPLTPPQFRVLARSFPVPRGSTATAGEGFSCSWSRADKIQPTWDKAERERDA